MGQTYCTEMTNRSLLKVAGEDARQFLHGLVTCDVEGLKTGDMAFGALLSPQGKILFDFFIVASINGFIIDVDRSMADDLARRLIFYRLRAKVDIGPMDERTSVFSIWDGPQTISEVVADGVVATDPRLPAMGARAYIRRAPPGVQSRSLAEWHQHRLAIGMPEGGIDFAFGDAFPHEALMDQFRGVDFQKGCYVGQEVVSRVQHRKSARKRLIMIAAKSDLPESGTEIIAAGKACGVLASRAGRKGLAMVRLDKAAPHVNGTAIRAGTLPVELKIQDWCSFDWPQEEG